MMSRDMIRTCPMHEGIPFELNPVLKLLDMCKGCWRGICTTCLVSIWNEQMNRWDPFFNHDDDNNDHAQIHSRRIESCAQAAGNAQGPPGIREYTQLVWSLSLYLLPSGCPEQRATWERPWNHMSTRLFCVDRVMATVLPQQLQQQPHAPDH